MDDELTPWKWSPADYADQIAKADKWWETATPQDRFKLWCAVVKTYDDEAVEAMSRLAALAYHMMVSRHPTLKIEAP